MNIKRKLGNFIVKLYGKNEKKELKEITFFKSADIN